MSDRVAARGVCIVTGGSRGIGAATAELAASRGYAVVITYRERSSDADAVVASIHAAGGQALAVRSDVGSEADVVRAFAAADALGPLTLLVNNAGVVGPVGRLEDVARGEMLEALFRTNVVGAFLAAPAALAARVVEGLSSVLAWVRTFAQSHAAVMPWLWISLLVLAYGLMTLFVRSAPQRVRGGVRSSGSATGIEWL